MHVDHSEVSISFGRSYATAVHEATKGNDLWHAGHINHDYIVSLQFHCTGLITIFFTKSVF